MSIVKELFSKLKKKKAIEQESAEKPYREILEKLSVGDEPDLATLEIVVERLGKTPEEIEKDVKLLKDRKERGEHVAKKYQAQQDLAINTAELERLNSEFEKIRQDYGAKQTVALAGVREAEFLLSQAESAERWLRENPLDKSQLPIVEDLRAKMRERTDRRRWLEDTIKDLETRIRLNQRQFDETKQESKTSFLATQADRNRAQGKHEQAEQVRQLIDRQEATLAQYRRELVEIREENEAYLRQIKHIEDGFIVP